MTGRVPRRPAQCRRPGGKSSCPILGGTVRPLESTTSAFLKPVAFSSPLGEGRRYDVTLLATPVAQGPTNRRTPVALAQYRRGSWEMVWIADRTLTAPVAVCSLTRMATVAPASSYVTRATRTVPSTGGKTA